MSYRGDIRLGDTIDVKFSTVGTTGAPTTLVGGTVAAYVGNGTTEITGAAVVLTTDFDARTGLHNVRVVATSGNGFATQTNVDLVLTAGTVGGTSVVGYVVGSFSIENRSALMPTTAGRTLVVDAAGLADANTVKLGPTGSGTAQTARDIGASVLLSNGTGTGQVSLSSGLVSLSGTQTFNVTGNITGNLSGSVGSVTGAVGSVTGAVGSVTGNVGGNVAGSVASVTGLTASDVAAIKAKTDNLTYTVAGQVDANIQYVNDVQVQGNGQAGTEWGPV